MPDGAGNRSSHHWHTRRRQCAIREGKSYFEDQFELNLRRVLCYFKLGKKDVACDYLREYVFTFPDSPYDTILQLCPEMVDNLDVMDILHGDR